MSSVFPTPASTNIGPSDSDSGEGSEKFEEELYVAYLQARNGGITVSSAGLVEWAQEIAISEGFYDREEAKVAITPEWLDGWRQRFNVNDLDDDVDDASDEDEETGAETSSLVLYPPPIDSPLTPSPPPSTKKTAGAKPESLGKSADLAPDGSDIENVVNSYVTTPAPRSRLYEQMLAESASRLLTQYMHDNEGYEKAVKPENLPPSELNRVLGHFFRNLHRPGAEDEEYGVKVLHGILEGVTRYLRSCGYSTDLAYESDFSDARMAFGERLSKAFEVESKQRHIASLKDSLDDGADAAAEIANVDDEAVVKKMQNEHHLRPLGSDEILPDEAMASFNKNTQKVMTWAAKNVVAFARDRLGLTQFTRVEEMPPKLLNIVLTRFFCESRKADGTEFGWNSYKSVFSNLEAYLRVYRYPLGLHDPVFRMAKQTLFNVLRPGGGSGAGSNSSSHHNQHGTSANSAHSTHQSHHLQSNHHKSGSSNVTTDGHSAQRPLYHRPIEINSAEESLLWQQGAFGWHSPQAINTTIYYYMRHIYGVRSGESHRRINFGDLRTMRTDDGREEFLVYTKAAAGVDMTRLRRMWATKDDRCIVRVFKVMVAKRPPETRKPDSPLYLQPKRQRQYNLDSNINLDSASLPTAEETGSDFWFTTAPLGKNALATLMRDAYQNCGIDQNRFAVNNGFGQPRNFENSNPSLLQRNNTNNLNNSEDDFGDESNGGDEAGSTRSSSSFSHRKLIHTQNEAIDLAPNTRKRGLSTIATN